MGCFLVEGNDWGVGVQEDDVGEGAENNCSVHKIRVYDADHGMEG